MMIFAQEVVQPQFGSIPGDWIVIALPLFVVALMAYVVFVRLPKTRRDSARMIELLESIDRRIADLDKRDRR